MAENENREEIDSNLKEIIKKAALSVSVSKEEAKKIIDQINDDFNFEKKLKELESIHTLSQEKSVIFTNDKEQLYYENGEFFIISTTDSTKKKIKKSRKEAIDLYNEYLITYILNPLINKKQQLSQVKTKSSQKVVTKEKIEEKKSQEKIEKENKIEKKKEEVKKSNENIEMIVEEPKPNVDEVQERLSKLKQKEEELKKKREKNIEKEL